jgi:hypothetical protein
MRILFFALVVTTLAWGQSQFSGQTEMNGIKFEDHKNFSTDWKLVTIRYRKDTAELRLTYANELAYTAMMAGKFQYPDGAVFAKTGIHTSADPEFTSSAIPRHIRRFQLMVKDAKKYKTTGGWGYALFDPTGKTFPEEPVATQEACYACHTVVRHKADVFSEPFSFVAGTKIAAPPSKAPSELSKLKFEKRATKKLSQALQKILTGHKHVSQLRHSLIEKHVFQGTLDELKPVLIERAMKDQQPAIFVSQDGERYILATPKKLDDCQGLNGIEIISTMLNKNLHTEVSCIHD